mmetsp:Transcript_34304/g.70140  ORF Transcript_34304/g.70140 Transcript_34304/m.70140 type:complete len:191 (-) Transcript_34304:83-655(-)
MGALIGLLVYVRKLMFRINTLITKVETQQTNTSEELRRTRAEVTSISATLGAAGLGEDWGTPGGAGPGPSSSGSGDRFLRLRRRPSLGAQSNSSMQSVGGASRVQRTDSNGSFNGGVDGGGYSSGEDLTSEEHMSMTRQTIKRTLSNSSIASVHRALSSTGTGALRESLSKNDIDTLVYMFGDDAEGVSC